MHFCLLALLPHVHPVVEHCLRFNPVVAAFDKAHHFFTCLG